MQTRTKPKYILHATVIITTALIVITGIGITLITSNQPAKISQTVGHTRRVPGSNWPGYLMDAQNTSYNPLEHTLTPNTISQLDLVGMYTVGNTAALQNAVASSIVAVDNTLYFGSWDGFEYAIDADTYALRWRIFLGVDTPPLAQQCFPQSAGVSSNASYADGVLYLGGGDGFLYALQATTGKILWKTLIATPPDEYLWSSPVLGNGHIYIGVASYGDCPLIRGRIIMLDPTQGTVQAIHYTVSAAQVGNSIWSKPVLDPADKAVVYATGNGPKNGVESQAIVALDWNTLALRKGDTFPLPKQELTELNGDPDFGASCMVVPNRLLSKTEFLCHNKNSIVYAGTITPAGLQINWTIKLGYGGDGPEHGTGDISAAVFDGHYAYFATSRVTIQKKAYASAIYSIDPTNGQIHWVTPINTYFPVAALAGANGVLVAGLTTGNEQGSMVVLAMADGAILYQHPLSLGVFGAPSIANGEIYVPTIDGHIYVFGLKNPLSSTDVFTGNTIGPNWSWVHHDPQHERLLNGALVIDAAGQSQVDAKNFLTQPAPFGDFTLTAHLSFLPKLNNEQASVIAYGDSDNYAKVSILKLSNGVDQFEFKVVDKGAKINLTQVIDPAVPGQPVFLRLIHLQATYYGMASVDGSHWIPLAASPVSWLAPQVGITAFSFDPENYASAAFTSCVLNAI